MASRLRLAQGLVRQVDAAGALPMLNDPLARVVPAPPETGVPPRRESGAEGLRDREERVEPPWETPAPPRQAITADDDAAAATANESLEHQGEDPIEEPERLALEPNAPPRQVTASADAASVPGAGTSEPADAQPSEAVWDARVHTFAGERFVVVEPIGEVANLNRAQQRLLERANSTLMGQLAGLALQLEQSHRLWSREAGSAAWEPAAAAGMLKLGRPSSPHMATFGGALLLTTGNRSIRGWALVPSEIDMERAATGSCLDALLDGGGADRELDAV